MIDVRQTPEFKKWFKALRDPIAFASIARRIKRFENGNFGDVESVGDGVKEMRVHVGAGYRVYFVERGATVVVLLCGGDKGSQQRDIDRAKDLAKQE